MTLRPEPYAAYATRSRLRRARAPRGRGAASAASRWPVSHSRGCWPSDEITAIVVGPGRAEHLDPAVEALSITAHADRDATHLTEVFA